MINKLVNSAATKPNKKDNAHTLIYVMVTTFISTGAIIDFFRIAMKRQGSKSINEIVNIAMEYTTAYINPRKLFVRV